MICPLMFSFAGDHDRGTLFTAGVSAAGLFPGVTPLIAGLAQRGVECHAFQSAAYTPGVATDLALHGATVHPFSNPQAGLAEVARVLARPGPLFAFVYLDTVDAVGHVAGPDAPQFDAEIVTLLDGLERLCRESTDGQLIVTADHGMTAIDPDATVYVNTEWPQLTDHLKRGADGGVLAPGGSARDLFLHVRDGCDPNRGRGARADPGRSGRRPRDRAAARRRCVRPSPFGAAARANRRRASCSRARARACGGTSAAATNSGSAATTAVPAMPRCGFPLITVPVG